MPQEVAQGLTRDGSGPNLLRGPNRGLKSVLVARLACADLLSAGLRSTRGKWIEKTGMVVPRAMLEIGCGRCGTRRHKRLPCAFQSGARQCPAQSNQFRARGPKRETSVQRNVFSAEICPILEVLGLSLDFAPYEIICHGGEQLNAHLDSACNEFDNRLCWVSWKMLLRYNIAGVDSFIDEVPRDTILAFTIQHSPRTGIDSRVSRQWSVMEIECTLSSRGQMGGLEE